MKRYKLQINTKNKKYSIFIGKNLINQLNQIFKKENLKFEKCLIVSDKKVPRSLKYNIKKNLTKKNTYLLNFNSNEKNKNLKSINNILNVLFKKNFSRNDCLISLGGGITGDISGFVASIYKRGIKFINIPTTLLAQVDSSIGGKTGINNNFGKNLVGSFYPPDLVVSDTNFLKTLPKREMICGYGEILKHAIIGSKNNFEYLNKNKSKILNNQSPFIEKTIFESCKIKKIVVQKDEKEKNLRKVLNFGHTFAHAYEASLKYSKKLNHGEAVILGIISASKFSFQNKILNKKDLNKILNHIKSLNLNFSLKNSFKINQANKILNFMKMDKKNDSSRINLVLLRKIGKPITEFHYSDKKIKSFLIKELI